MTSASAPAPRARLDDLVAGTTLQFGRFAREIRAERPEEVRPALAEIEQAVADGAWAVVMIAYEAAAGLDPDAQVHGGQDGLPLVWAGIAEAPDPDPAPLTPAGEAHPEGDAALRVLAADVVEPASGANVTTDDLEAQLGG